MMKKETSVLIYLRTGRTCVNAATNLAKHLRDRYPEEFKVSSILIKYSNITKPGFGYRGMENCVILVISVSTTAFLVS